MENSSLRLLAYVGVSQNEFPGPSIKSEAVDSCDIIRENLYSVIQSGRQYHDAHYIM